MTIVYLKTLERLVRGCTKDNALPGEVPWEYQTPVYVRLSPYDGDEQVCDDTVEFDCADGTILHLDLDKEGRVLGLELY